MKLSVLIPMYNAENYISNCIDSLLDQDLDKEDYEIIIMDDGSTDNSVTIVNEYKALHNNIILKTEPNSGSNTTRNKLFKLAQGTYIYYFDADDYIVSNCLGELLKTAENKELDIVGFETIQTLTLDDNKLTQPITSKDVIFSSGKTFIENNPHLRYEIWWYFIKRDFMLEHKISFNTNEYNGDVIFTLEVLLKANKLGYFPVSIHRYVQTQYSVMRNKSVEAVNRRIKYLNMMIVSTSQLINEIKTEGNSTVLIQNMSHRRDVFTFFNIISMIRNSFNRESMQLQINTFKDVNAYPIKQFNHYRYNSLLYRSMVSLINQEKNLYILLYVRNVFSNSNK